MGRKLVPKVLFTFFREFPRLLGITAAAMLPKQARGTFRKHITKPSEQVSAPPSRRDTNLLSVRTKLSVDLGIGVYFLTFDAKIMIIANQCLFHILYRASHRWFLDIADMIND